MKGTVLKHMATGSIPVLDEGIVVIKGNRMRKIVQDNGGGKMEVYVR